MQPTVSEQRSFNSPSREDSLRLLKTAVELLPELRFWHGLEWKETTNFTATFFDRPGTPQLILDKAVSVLESRGCPEFRASLPAGILPIRSAHLIDRIVAGTEAAISKHSEMLQRERFELSPRALSQTALPAIAGEAEVVSSGAYFNSLSRLYHIVQNCVADPALCTSLGYLHHDGFCVSAHGISLRVPFPDKYRTPPQNHKELRARVHSLLQQYVALVTEPEEGNTEVTAVVPSAPLRFSRFADRVRYDWDDFDGAAHLAKETALLLWQPVQMNFRGEQVLIAPTTEMTSLCDAYLTRQCARSVLRRWANESGPDDTREEEPDCGRLKDGSLPRLPTT